jgi:sugar phosphate isomerase/epimerase
MSYLSLSTWSLHRLLGPLRWTIWDAERRQHLTREEEQPLVHTLLELPAEAARRGYRAIEVCHFHFPATDEDYLRELGRSFEAAGVAFDTLLLDYGDLTAGDENRRQADIRLFREWIGIAALSGARQIRLIAGEASPDDDRALRDSAEALVELSAYAASLGVAVVTENFKTLTATGEGCLKLLDYAAGSIRMITDFGNFRGKAKYSEIAATTPYSVSIHAKPSYDEHGWPDETEFERCLEAVRSTGYDGAYVLIYDGPGDMWEGLERVKRLVQPSLE